jgi:hypothetical protein
VDLSIATEYTEHEGMEIFTFMENVGYEVCKSWLERYRWQDILPREESPQPGEEAVKAFAPQLALPARKNFVKGWNRYLTERGYD